MPLSTLPVPILEDSSDSEAEDGDHKAAVQSKSNGKSAEQPAGKKRKLDAGGASAATEEEEVDDPSPSEDEVRLRLAVALWSCDLLEVKPSKGH